MRDVFPWEMHQQEHGRRHRAGALVTLAIVAVIAAAAAAAITVSVGQSTSISPSSSRDQEARDDVVGINRNHRACRHRLAAFLWLSVICSVLALGVHLAVQVSSRIRRWISATAWGRDCAFGVCTLLSLAVGITGFQVLCAVDGSNERGDVAWPRMMASILAVTWIAAAVTCVGLAVAVRIQYAPPNREMTPALMVLRCACWSSPVKHLLVALPFIALASTAFVLWTQADESSCGVAPNEPRALLLGDAVVFSLVVIATAASAGLRRVQVSHPRRRLHHAVSLGCLLAFGVVMVLWVIRSYRWLATRNDATIHTDCANATDLAGDVQVLTMLLAIAAVLLLALTTCCRLERHLLPVANTPQIDHSMLSPHATRPPTRTDSV